MIRKQLADYLIDRPDIKALVDKKIYPVRIPQVEDLPAIAYRKESGNGWTYHLEGTARHVLSTIRIDCWARSYGKAWEIAAAVRDALQGAQGITIGEYQVDQCELVDDYDEIDDEVGGGDDVAFSAVLIFEFMYQSFEV